MAEQCYICGKPATQAINIMFDAAASAGSIFKPVCDDHGYRDPRNVLIANQSARIAELEELEAGRQKYIDIIVAASEKEHAAYEAQSAELADMREKMADPFAVHVNILRGVLAKPTWAAIKHLYPAEFEAEFADQSAALALAEGALEPFAKAWFKAAPQIKTPPRLAYETVTVKASDLSKVPAALAAIAKLKGTGEER